MTQLDEPSQPTRRRSRVQGRTSRARQRDAEHGAQPTEILASPDTWDTFYQTSISLSAVTESTGLPAAPALAKDLSGAFDVEQLADSSQPFLYGMLQARAPTAPQAVVSGFLDEADRALPGATFSPENATVLTEQTSRIGRHVVAQQTLRGAEVIGARLNIHVGPANDVYSLTGRPLGDLPSRDPGEPPRTSDIDAMESIRSHFKLPPEIPVSVTRVIVPVDDGAVWAFEGRFVVYNPIANVRAYVRADDFQPLFSYNIAAALHGEARVYPVNPLRTPNPRPVRLDHLGPVPPDRLTGSVVDVRPRNGAAFSQAFRDCRLEPGDAGFDEAHAYHHICAAIRYFQSLLDSPLLSAAPFTPLKAIVRDPFSPNNAFFVPDTGELLLGDFGDRPSARSAEIIYHEFTHAIVDSICRLGRGPESHTQARGMNEGYADYFAASALDDPRIGDYAANRPEGARNCGRADLRFPAGFVGREHATGEVWAAVLWSIRQECGDSVADVIALESLPFLNRFSTFEEGRAALVTADRRLFPTADEHGRHEDIINDKFQERLPA